MTPPTPAPSPNTPQTPLPPSPSQAAAELPHDQQVAVLLQALPYMQRFRDRVVVVKFGGNAMSSPELFRQFAADIILMHSIGIKPVIVHGGGPQIGDWLAKLGKQSEFVDGQRVTDAETLEVAQMVLVGKVNSEIVSALNVLGPVAVGLSGNAARLIEAAPRDPVLGFVGDVVGINAELVERMLAMDLVPVVSTIGADADGQAYNINADAVASAVAKELHAEKLIFLTDIEGVLTDVDDADSLIHEITVSDADALISDGTIRGGMIPKVRGCIDAIHHGVAQVHLVDGREPHVLLLELFTDAGVGTMVTGDPS